MFEIIARWTELWSQIVDFHANVEAAGGECGITLQPAYLCNEIGHCIGRHVAWRFDWQWAVRRKTVVAHSAGYCGGSHRCYWRVAVAELRVAVKIIVTC